jgi:hypothetical protein
MSITHETRRESHEQVKPKKADRKALIRGVLQDGAKTAHEITQALLYMRIIPYYDRNFVSPRLTELKEMGEVEVIGKKYEGRTDRKVAVWQLKEDVE